MLQIVVHNSSSSNWAVLIAVHVEGPNWIDDGMRIWEFVEAREKVKKDVFFPLKTLGLEANTALVHYRKTSIPT